MKRLKPVLTKELKKLVIEELKKNGGNITAAFKNLNVKRHRLYYALRSDVGFRKELQETFKNIYNAGNDYSHLYEKALKELPSSFSKRELDVVLKRNKLGLSGFYNCLNKGTLKVERKTKGVYDKISDTLFNDQHIEQLTGQKPITLKPIAEKTKRPLTISEIENTEHYQNLRSRVEELEGTIEENVDNSYRWNDKVKELKAENEALRSSIKDYENDGVNFYRKWDELTTEIERLKESMPKYKEYKELYDWFESKKQKYENETKKEAFLRLIKNKDIQLAFWAGWLINTILTLIVSQVLK